MSELWNEVRQEYLNSCEQILLGKYLSFMMQDDPKSIAFLFSKYKFASKIIGRNKDILEVGCSEGHGALLLVQESCTYTGIDSDMEAIEYANKTYNNEKLKFIYGDFLEYSFANKFDAVVSFDVIEHIPAEFEDCYVQSICNRLKQYGITIVSTPNITAFEYASPQAKKAHINNYSYDRLLSLFEKYFHNVMLFSRNDEIIHTGFYPMAHHLIIVAISPK